MTPCKPMKKPLNVAFVQHQCSAAVEENIAAWTDGLKRAASQGADLVLLQELHNSQYFCQTEDAGNFDLAEAVPGRTTDLLEQLARQLNIVIVSSVFERRASGVYHNTAVVMDRDGSIAGRYRKMHIPDDPGYHEKYYFTPGDLGFTPVSTSLGRLGVLVCWDQWFPEAARLMALNGADILLYPTAIGWDDRDNSDEQARQLDAWLTIQRAHAIANGLPLVACNRTGLEAEPGGQSPGIRFWGSSFICGAQGEILYRAAADANEVAVVALDTENTEKVRRVWPFLRDRRIDSYQELSSRYIDNQKTSVKDT
jgi:N-carbamoylputrescine amidase